MKKIAVWVWLILLKRPYHFLMPRISIKKKIYNIPFIINPNDHLDYFIADIRKWLLSSVKQGDSLGWLLQGSYLDEIKVKGILEKHWGTVWDVGSNFGLYSVVAAKAENKVVAFDLSPLAIKYVKKSARLNHLKIDTIDRPMTVDKVKYHPPKDSKSTSTLVPKSGGLDSITYREVAEEYGVPDFIKMDIEGGEKEFLESDDFLKWIIKNKISFLVELHHGYLPKLENYPAIKCERVDDAHVLLTV